MKGNYNLHWSEKWPKIEPNFGIKSWVKKSRDPDFYDNYTFILDKNNYNNNNNNNNNNNKNNNNDNNNNIDNNKRDVEC